MKIALGSDHGGYALKCDIIQLLEKLGHEYKDFGCYSTESCDYPDFGEASRQRLLDRMIWLDGEIAGRNFIAGDAFSMADIATLTILDFAGFVGIAIPEGAANLKAWHARISARPSAAA